MKLDYIKGMTWGWVGTRGTWATKEADFSMEEMAKLGVNWTAIAFAALQDHPQATEINYKNAPIVTDEEVLWAIEKAKKLGLKVCLKPVVNCANGTWRAHINFFDVDVPCEPKWRDWFASYTEFVLHYAKIAQETGCEMFCVGCEMVQTDRRADEWRVLIAKVREVYTGIITYNCDKYQETNVTWWDAVDVISSSGYYPIDSWDERVEVLEAFAAKHDKPFFFMETGCPSRTGSSMLPNDWGLEGAPSMKEQDDFYRVMFDKIGSKPWFYGFMLWDWPAKLYSEEEAAGNDDYCMYKKTASATVEAFYRSK
ncbi:glycoside hydrolase family 113 [Paenibacillus hexagrammi]|uniref:1,4-beta-xylanase n=1 Tax=Paenibacillus hexagrammi TaxID=2908839 RepID=A0ABY3SHX8_9BACL|nr:1,4-beta-xylanase [Paenibacillus sp. YPD9-1]UJF32725.1 1,4-beta-xylanase [Paenibacillus sp. YPD9-1]